MYKNYKAGDDNLSCVDVTMQASVFLGYGLYKYRIWMSRQNAVTNCVLFTGVKTDEQWKYFTYKDYYEIVRQSAKAFIKVNFRNLGIHQICA